MGTLKSAHNWSGRIVGGTILGEPARSVPGDPINGIPPSGDYLWDGAVSDGVIDDTGNVVTETLGQIAAPELAPDVPPVTAAEKDAGIERYEKVADEVVAYDSKDVVVDRDKVEVKYEEVKVDLVEIKAVAVDVVGDVKPR